MTLDLRVNGRGIWLVVLILFLVEAVQHTDVAVNERGTQLPQSFFFVLILAFFQTFDCGHFKVAEHIFNMNGKVLRFSSKSNITQSDDGVEFSCSLNSVIAKQLDKCLHDFVQELAPGSDLAVVCNVRNHSTR